jgi:hypothetical protein
MRQLLVSFSLLLVVSACAGGANSVNPALQTRSGIRQSSGAAPPASNAGPASSVTINYVTAPSRGKGIAIGVDGSIYYATGGSVERYSNGTFVTTQAAADPSGGIAIGGQGLLVIGSNGVVYWDMMYNETAQGGADQYVDTIQSGAMGATANFNSIESGGSIIGAVSSATTGNSMLWVNTDLGLTRYAIGAPPQGLLGSAIDGRPGPYYAAMIGASDNTLWAFSGAAGGGPFIDHYGVDNALIMRYPLSAHAGPPNAPYGVAGLAFDNAGNVWFTDATNNAIGELKLPLGTVTEYPVPTPNAGLINIVLAADGAMWFTESTAGKIGRVTLAGHFSEYTIQSGIHPQQIASPPAAASCSPYLLWFTTDANELGSVHI